MPRKAGDKTTYARKCPGCKKLVAKAAEVCGSCGAELLDDDENAVYPPSEEAVERERQRQEQRQQPDDGAEEEQGSAAGDDPPSSDAGTSRNWWLYLLAAVAGVSLLLKKRPEADEHPAAVHETAEDRPLNGHRPIVSTWRSIDAGKPRRGAAP